MAGGDEMLGVGGAVGVGAALLFIGAGTNVYDAFSAVMSSPWSTAKFTADSEDAAKARKYVRHAVIISWIYALGGALIVSKSSGKLALFPVAGAAIVTVYMVWLYRDAINTGVSENGSAMRKVDSGNGDS
jgi:hypothetical protein